MKLNELKPALGSTTAPRRLGRGVGSGLGKTSVPRPVAAAASVRASKAARCLWFASCRSAALRTFSPRNTPPST